MNAVPVQPDLILKLIFVKDNETKVMMMMMMMMMLML